MQIFTPTISSLAVNIKPVMVIYLNHEGSIGRREGWVLGCRGGVGVGVSGANRRGGEEERRRGGEGPIHEVGSSEPLI